MKHPLCGWPHTFFPFFFYENQFNIGIKHVFPCISLRSVPREVMKTEGAAPVFQHLPSNPANVNARKNMFDLYRCINVSQTLILGRYSDALFWKYAVLSFFNIVARRLFSLISLFQGHLTGAKSWQKTGKDSQRDQRIYKMKWLSGVDNVFFLLFVCHFGRPFRPASISIFIPEADTGATRLNNNCAEMDY